MTPHQLEEVWLSVLVERLLIIHFHTRTPVGGTLTSSQSPVMALNPGTWGRQIGPALEPQVLQEIPQAASYMVSSLPLIFPRGAPELHA